MFGLESEHCLLCSLPNEPIHVPCVFRLWIFKMKFACFCVIFVFIFQKTETTFLSASNFFAMLNPQPPLSETLLCHFTHKRPCHHKMVRWKGSRRRCIRCCAHDTPSRQVVCVSLSLFVCECVSTPKKRMETESYVRFWKELAEHSVA